MKILISGSNGFIGSNLVEALQKKNYEVYRLLRKKSKNLINTVYCDFENEVYNLSDFEGFDAFIHLAGENIVGRWTDTKKNRIRSSRIESTNLIYKIFSQLKDRPKTFICASAIGYYGNGEDSELTESSDSGSGFLAEVCKDWENASNRIKFLDIRVVNLRTGLVLSNKGGALLKMLTPFKMGLGGRLGKGNQYMSWITIRDEIEGIIFLLENDNLEGAFNLVSPSPLTNSDFTEILGRVLNRPIFLNVPEFAIKLLFGDMGKEAFLNSQRVIPEKLLNSGFQFEDTDLEQTLQEMLDR